MNRISEKLLGIEIDSNFSFQSHVNSICKKASFKSHALARAAPYMNIRQRIIIINALFNS